MDRIDAIIEQWRRARPDLDVEPMRLIGRLTRLARRFGREMEATFDQHDLTMASFDVLATLRRAEPPHRLSPGELMEWTMVTSGTMTHRVDQLVRAGYVERVRNPDDGRSVLIQLTEAGHAVIDDAMTDHVETLARLTEDLTESETRRLNRLLQAYWTRLDESDDAI